MSDVQNSPHNPYAPPTAQVGDAPDATGGVVLASRWARLGGSLVDVVIVLAALWILSRVTPWNPFDASRADWTRFSLIDPILGFVLFLVVQGYPLAKSGQTWGKKVVGTRIVRPDGTPVPFGRLIGLRYGVPALFGIVPALAQVFNIVNALAIFRASRRCLHDSIADTIVIKA